ncbi:uncharacterized protein LOC126324050 isoform X2 [Schistocerca gregaria]|nr:uncharacterized protein LOC126324050 isoform X2 [Schistocerca gregaria]
MTYNKLIDERLVNWKAVKEFFPSQEEVKKTSLDYLSLCKPRLASFVLFSTLFGYFMASGPNLMIDPVNLFATLAGTAMTIASANSMNQYLEADHDSKMKRTKNRALPAKKLTPNQVFSFSLFNGILGALTLGLFSTHLATILSVSNLFLYTFVYTPFKRVHHSNTWIGAVVGAIPPLIGYAARYPTLDAHALFLFLILFLWQLPHFYSLSWQHRHDYQVAGYKMLSNVRPSLLPRQTLIWTSSLFLLPLISTYFHLTSPWIILETSPLSIYCLLCARNFSKQPTNANASLCFRSSLLWLPFFLLSLILHKTDDD